MHRRTRAWLIGWIVCGMVFVGPVAWTDDTPAEVAPADENAAPAADEKPAKGVHPKDNLNLWISYFIPGMDTYDSGKYVDTEILTSEAKDENQKRNQRLAYTYDEKGMALAALGEYKDAEWCLQEALCIKEQHLGKNARPVPTTLNNLADLYYISGDIDKVEPLYRRALEILEEDQYNINVSRALNGIALLHYDRGEYEQAEGLLKQAAYLHDKANRRHNPYMGTVLTNLATLYTHLDRLDEAKEMFRAAERVQQVTLDDMHPDVAIRLSSYSVYLAKKGKYDESREAEREAQEIREKFAAVNNMSILK